MPTKDPRIDAYIKKSAPFAQPIMSHFRSVMHKACPAVTETVKWGFPHFEHHGIICAMAAFKEHCRISFWKASLMKDPAGILRRMGKTDMAAFDRLTSLKDLPADKILITYIKEAAHLNESAIKLPAKPKKKAVAKEVKVPPVLAAALRKNKKAATAFENFSPSHRKEYIEWITEAKTEDTRNKRIATTIEWLVEGKSRNWKYKKKK